MTERPLRVAIVARSDGSHGGAGQVAETLADGLRARGHAVHWFAKVSTRDAARRTLPALRGDAVVRQLTGTEPAGLALQRELRALAPDVVHIHDPVVAFGWRSTRAIAARWPTVATLHDFSAIFGGCVMTMGCDRGPLGCGACPQRGQWPLVLPWDRSKANARESATLAAHLYAVTPSAWLASQAELGAYRGRRPQVIPNAVDEVFLRPLPRRGRRGPGQPLHVLVVATRLGDPRKGVDLAMAACAALNRPVSLHLIGMGTPPEAPRGLEVHTHAPVFDREKLREAYLAADVVLVPSRLESFGLVAAEALCVGAPTVVTPAGALPEVLAGHAACAVARTMEPADLAAAIEHVAESDDRGRVQRARAAQAQFGTHRFIEAHEHAYLRVIAAARR